MINYERQFLVSWDEVFYPKGPEMPVEEEARPVRMAQAGGGLPEMKAYDPTTRQRIASFLQAGFEGVGLDRAAARRNAQTLIGGESSNLPLGLGLADIVPFLGTALQTEEAVRMGKEAVQAGEKGEATEAAVLGAGAALGMVPGAVGTAKTIRAVKRKAKE